MTAKPANNPVAEFGAFVRARRISLDLLAREVAERAGLQPSNFSNLEHGFLAPSSEPAKIKNLATALKIKKGTPEFAQFSDLAGKATNSVPVDIADIITADEAIPVMLRSIGNKRLTKKDIEGIVALVRGR